MISLIIPSYNNLRHLKNVYSSIKRHAPEAEVILLDDGSTDGTWEWLQRIETAPGNKTRILRSEKRVGHTILYDKGIELATNKIVGILHADMIIGPNYVENIIKHLQPGKVVCATRIEPPLHPEGKEKIVKDFGLDFDTLNIPAFEEYCIQSQLENKDKTTKGMFAPWVLYKSDFQAIGGHDPLFAPFPYEDSDIFQRWILAGYELIQSRDSFVYHLTCRGHRWNEKVGVDDDYYKMVSQKAARNYLRKWGSWIKNDEYQHPIIPHKYGVGLVVKNCNLELLRALEPWCDKIYIEDDMGVITTNYIEEEQKNTKFDLSRRIRLINHHDPICENDIVVEFDGTMLNQNNFIFIERLSEILTENEISVGYYEMDIFKFHISSVRHYENDLIKIVNNYA
jgi:glycosyltransferase involved in cell wall biosynthesis